VLLLVPCPAAEDVDLILYSLANVSRELTGGTPLSTPCPSREHAAFGLVDFADTYVQEVHRTMRERQPTPLFVSMAGSYPASIHDLLCDEDPLSEGSSMGDNYPNGPSPPQHVCAMATAPHEPPLEVQPSRPTHTVTSRIFSECYKVEKYEFQKNFDAML
jgi:hypothetical protein